MLVSLEALAADQPGMAVLQFENPRRRMEQDRNIQIRDLLVERKEHFVVEIAVTPAANVQRFKFWVVRNERERLFTTEAQDVRKNPFFTKASVISI